MSADWQFRTPGAFTVGAMGEPGHRVFYFQAFGDDTEVDVKCEKQQALALAEHLEKLLADLPGDAVPEVPAVEALPPGDLAFVVGSISVGVDPAEERLVVLFEELVIDPDDDEVFVADPCRLRVHLSKAQVRGFAAQARALVATSRPVCRLCEQPIDPTGHACPRLN